MKLIYKIIAGSGLVVVPASVATGIYFGVDNSLDLPKPQAVVSYGDRYFDNIIAAPSGEVAFAESPVDGENIADIQTFDKRVDFKHTRALMKSTTPIFTKTVSFRSFANKADVIKARKELNKAIVDFRNAQLATNPEVQLSKFIGKDFISRTITVSIYERNTPDAYDKQLMDEFVQDIGQFDLSKLEMNLNHPSGSGPTWNNGKPVFFEMFGTTNLIGFVQIKEYFPTATKDSTAFKAFMRKWGLVSITHDQEEVETPVFSNSNPTYGVSFPKSDFKFKWNYPQNAVKLNKKSASTPAYFFARLLNRGIIPTYNTVMDMKTGEYKLIVTFNKWKNHYVPLDVVPIDNDEKTKLDRERVNFDLNKDVPYIDMALGEFPINPDIQYQKIISGKMDGSDNPNNALGNANTIAAGAARQEAIGIMKNAWTKKFAEYAKKPIVKPGLKLLTTYLPSLNNSLTPFIDAITLMQNSVYNQDLFGTKTTKWKNADGSEEDVTGDQFADKLVQELERSKLVDADKILRFAQSFDINWWSSIDNLTGLVPSDGGQYNLYQLVAMGSLLSDKIVDRIEQMHPGAVKDDLDPTIPKLLNWLVAHKLLKQGQGIEDIMSAPLPWAQNAIAEMARQKISVPLDVLQTLLPLVPVDLISAHADTLAHALYDNIFSDGRKVAKILNAIKLDAYTMQESMSMLFAGPLSYLETRLAELKRANNQGVFDKDVCLMIGKALEESKILPSFLNGILPSTEASAERFAKLIHNGGMSNLLGLFTDAKRVGLANVDDWRWNDLFTNIKDAFSSNVVVDQALVDATKSILKNGLSATKAEMEKLISFIASITGNSSASATDLANTLFKTSNQGLASLSKTEIEPIVNMVKAFVAALKTKDTAALSSLVHGLIHGYANNAAGLKADISAALGASVLDTDLAGIKVGDLLEHLITDTTNSSLPAMLKGFVTNDIWISIHNLLTQGLSGNKTMVKEAIVKASTLINTLAPAGSLLGQAAADVLTTIDGYLQKIVGHEDEVVNAIDALMNRGLKDITSAEAQGILKIVSIFMDKNPASLRDGAAIAGILNGGFDLTPIQAMAIVNAITTSIADVDSMAELIVDVVSGTQNVDTLYTDKVANPLLPAAVPTLDPEVALTTTPTTAKFHFRMTYAQIVTTFNESVALLENPTAAANNHYRIVHAAYWLDEAPKLIQEYNAAVTAWNAAVAAGTIS